MPIAVKKQLITDSETVLNSNFFLKTVLTYLLVFLYFWLKNVVLKLQKKETWLLGRLSLSRLSNYVCFSLVLSILSVYVRFCVSIPSSGFLSHFVRFCLILSVSFRFSLFLSVSLCFGLF